MMFRLLQRVFKNTWLVNSCIALIYFPGTVVHELSHFIAAIVAFLKVRDLHVLPEWDHKSIKLGHVTYEKADPIRGILVGISPLFGATLLFWALYQFEVFPHESIVISIAVGYLVFSVSSTMFSSKQDLVDLVAALGFFFALSIVLGAGLVLFEVNIGLLFQRIPLVVYERMAAFLFPVNMYMYGSVLIHGGIIALGTFVRILRGKNKHVYNTNKYK
jgi:hypothetical protein